MTTTTENPVAPGVVAHGAPDAAPGVPTPPGPPSSGRRRPGGSGQPAGAERPRRGVPRGGRAVVDVLVLAGAVLAALTPLLPVYGGSVLLAPVVGGVLLGAAAGVLSAWARWSPPVTTAVLLTVTVVLGGPLATPDQTVGGVVPTLASIVSVVRGSGLGWKDVLTLQPPLGGSGWLLVPPYLLAVVGTAVAVRLALGSGRAAPAAALLPPVVLAGAVLLGTHTTVAPVAAGTAIAVVLLVWASWRSGRLRARRPVALVLLVALAGGAGVAAGTTVESNRDRYVLRDALLPPFDPRDYASPLSAFRKYVKDDDTVELFTVQGLPAGARVRLATFDRFDGVVWNVAGDGSSRASGQFRRVGEVVSEQAVEEADAVEASGTGGERAEVQVQVDGLSGVWLPTVGEAVSVRFDDTEAQSRLRFNDATGAAVLTGGLDEGLTYTLDAVVPAEPDDEQLGSAAGSALDLPEPQGVPDAVSTAAGDAAREAETPAQVARALEQALSERGFFSHGRTDQGDYPSLSGHGADRVATLLGGDLMVGDDEQYASAMALMAREMGLPARVVMGFVPGDDEEAAATPDAPLDPDAPVVVTGADVHAWVEIAFEGYGWVTFDPTPPESQTPQDEQETSQADPEPQVAQPPPPPAPPVDPPADDTDQPQTQDGEDESALAVWQRIALGVAAGSGLLLVLLAPFLVIAGLKARRRRRRRRDPVPVNRVVGGWQEVLDLATDLRRDVDPVATRREGARSLDRAFTTAPEPEEGRRRKRPAPVPAGPTPAGVEAGAAVVALADRADAAVFGAAAPTTADAREYWAEVDRTLASMRAATPRKQRWRGRVATRSLRRSERRRAAAAADRARRSAPDGREKRGTRGRRARRADGADG
ncbi:transglutaminase domain-containing protein [Cellulomonas sp. Y8]|uniref:transglutaminase family protein n=1 Tax=Cellulomonas sp. Y8 TaxID=2591145 RepID=UPI0011C736F7|nr:transglutaminase domain-containing protein [Cellulomonas sp. Y8]